MKAVASHYSESQILKNRQLRKDIGNLKGTRQTAAIDLLWGQPFNPEGVKKDLTRGWLQIA